MTITPSPALIAQAADALEMAMVSTRRLVDMSRADPEMQLHRRHALDEAAIAVGILERLAPPLDTEPYRVLVEARAVPFNDAAPLGGPVGGEGA